MNYDNENGYCVIGKILYNENINFVVNTKHYGGIDHGSEERKEDHFRR